MRIAQPRFRLLKRTLKSYPSSAPGLINRCEYHEMVGKLVELGAARAKRKPLRRWAALPSWPALASCLAGACCNRQRARLA
jgi:hypothetical protein